MPFFSFHHISVAGISSAIPQDVVELDAFNPSFGGEVVAKFKKMTGVEKFHKAQKGQTASDLGFVAAQTLIEKKQIDINEIGIIVLVTKTPDYRVPATACVLHKRLKLPKDCIAFDVNLGCSGFVYGIQVVCSLLQNVNTRYGLLIVGDTTTSVVCPQDKSIAMLFGDGASATLLEKTNEAVSIKVQTKSDGEGFKAIIIPAGGFRFQHVPGECRVGEDGNTRSDYDLYVNGTDVFNFSMTEVPRLVKEYLENNQLQADDFDCFAFHQANEFMLKQIIKKAKLPAEKVPINISKYGNTSGNSIPLLLADIYGEGSDRNIRVLACGFGVGLSWGVADFTVNTNDVLPVIETNDYYQEAAVSLE